MSVKRVVDTAFWTDEKVIDMFSPEDKLFMLYLLTNQHTTQLGIYRVHEKEIAFEIGYSVESVKVLLERFETKYKMIRYNVQTKEVAIRNFLRHSIIKGGKPVEDLLTKEIKMVKDKNLLLFIYDYLSKCDNLNETVRTILHYIDELYNIKNDNDNDNDNDVSYHESWHESYDESYSESCGSSDLLFDEFWEAYPKKINKKGAKAAFKRIKHLKEKFPVIMEAIEKFKKTQQWLKNDGQFIPYPTSWINQERWNDQIILESLPKQQSFETDEFFNLAVKRAFEGSINESQNT